MSQTQSEKSPTPSDEESQSEAFEPKEKKSAKKSQSKRTNKSEPKQIKVEPDKKEKKKGGKRKQKEQKPSKTQKPQKPQKVEKAEKSKKQAPAKRKPKSKKDAGKDGQQNKTTVLEYMKKQNRPYNLLNVFDNLHGKIKKPELETILNELADQNELQCKEFGKNKVYFLNQDKFDLNMKEVEELSSTYTKLKEEHQELREANKALNDEYRKLMAKKTFEELEMEGFDLGIQISKLKKKRDSLMNGDVEKVDEQEVITIEKDMVFLQKQLNKRRKLVKQCLSAWAEVAQKKIPDLAEEMGIQLI